MKKLTLCAVAMIGAACLAQAQTTPPPTYNSSMISSGPYMLRKSTGDKTVDRLLFIMDRTLSSTDMQTIRDMFAEMPANEVHLIQRAIVYAIDDCAKQSPDYASWYGKDWASDNGVSDTTLFHSMEGGLGWSTRASIDDWLNTATDTQITAVAKLIRRGGWANSLWASSGMDNGQ